MTSKPVPIQDAGRSRGEVGLNVSLRAYAILTLAIALWSLTVVLLVFKVLDWPYLGAEFDAQPDVSSVLVSSVREGSPAAAAGLGVGDEIVAVQYGASERYEMTGLEAIPGREELHSYEMSDRTQAAKAAMWEILGSGPLTFETREGARFSLTPRDGRTFFSLSASFYILAIQSLVITMIAAGILAFAPVSLPVGLLVLSGLAMVVNMFFNMAGFASELSMPDALYVARRYMVPVAVLTFSLSLLALLWYFPEPISRFPFGWAVLGYGLFVISAQHLQYFVFPLHPYQGPIILTMIAAVIVSVISWRRTRDKPIQRASVMWFVLSISAVTGFVTLFYNLPAFFRVEPILGTGPALFAVTLIYVGIALGTLRYRLFDIQRIWWRTVTWIAGGVLVVLADLILVAQFDLQQPAALPIALLIAGWAYFPIRHFILERFVKTSTIRVDRLLPKLIASFSGLDGKEAFDGRLIAFLREVFGAQEIGPIRDEHLAGAVVGDNGLTLRVPDIAGERSFEITGKSAGRQLFSMDDVAVANTFLRLIRHMEQANQREQEQVQQDRERIVRDLHDDVGARLLSMAYTSPDKGIAAQAREALAALKDTLVVIENTETVDLRDGWKRVASDMSQRLTGAGFEPRHEQVFQCERVLSAREYTNIKRIVQEITSNAIKYGRPGNVDLRLEVAADGTVHFRARNDVRPIEHEDAKSRRGLHNIETRLVEIGGKLVHAGEANGSYIVEFCLPFAD